MKKLIIGFTLLATVSASAGGEIISKGVAVGALGLMGYNTAKSTEKATDCGKTGGANALACAMMVMYAATALQDGKTAKSAKISAQQFAGDNWDPNMGNGMTDREFDRQLDLNKEAMAPVLKKAADNKLPVDPNTGMISTPKGMKTAADLSTGKGMFDAGLIEGSQIEEADKILAADRKGRPQFKNIAMTSTAGGGYSGSRAPASANYAEANYNYAMPQEKPEAPKTAGLVKIAGGESIGSQSDNIFEMLHRKYQQKSGEKMFVGQEE